MANECPIRCKHLKKDKKFGIFGLNYCNKYKVELIDVIIPIKTAGQYGYMFTPLRNAKCKT